jgi:hypothetical protein
MINFYYFFDHCIATARFRQLHMTSSLYLIELDEVEHAHGAHYICVQEEKKNRTFCSRSKLMKSLLIIIILFQLLTRHPFISIWCTRTICIRLHIIYTIN